MRHKQTGIKKIDSILFSYRASKHRSTGYSPFYMMFHRQPRLPVDAELFGEGDACDLKTDVDVFMEKMLKRQNDVKSNAAGNIAKAQAKQKEDYDKRHSPEVSYT